MIMKMSNIEYLIPKQCQKANNKTYKAAHLILSYLKLFRNSALDIRYLLAEGYMGCGKR